jgi:Ca-activated chloride channel family protein
VTFPDPRWLLALLIVPVLWLLDLVARRRARRNLARLIGERPDSVLRAQVLAGSRRAGALLRLGALIALIVGAAGPEWGREVVRRASSGSDVVLVLDASASMDTRDVAPSRIEEARREALAALDRLEGSRVGVVAFAGDASRLWARTSVAPFAWRRGSCRLGGAMSRPSCCGRTGRISSAGRGPSWTRSR